MDWNAVPAYLRPPEKRDDVGLMLPIRWSDTLRQFWAEQVERPREQRIYLDLSASAVAEQETARFIDDETVDVAGNPLPRGRCDECGAPCDAITGKCMREPEKHQVAQS